MTVVDRQKHLTEKRCFRSAIPARPQKQCRKQTRLCEQRESANGAESGKQKKRTKTKPLPDRIRDKTAKIPQPRKKRKRQKERRKDGERKDEKGKRQKKGKMTRKKATEQRKKGETERKKKKQENGERKKRREKGREKT